MAEWQGRDADAEMDLLEFALGFEMDGRVGVRGGVLFSEPGGLQSPNSCCTSSSTFSCVTLPAAVMTR